MQKKTPDYDNVFKTLKIKHKRLFISVINHTFGKDYPMDTNVEILPSEGYLTEGETPDGRKEIAEKISDFLIKIENEIYLLECQSYDDGSMAIRIAEYAFIAARQFATWDIGHATISMPRFSVIYIKKTDNTPKTTVITFIFPDGQIVNYESDNVILEQYSKEDIMEKRLFPYIPFYIARYERVISLGENIDQAIEDLTYFRDEMQRLHGENELSDAELTDLMGFVNTIITHITNGNKNEERLVNIMGGVVIETASEKLIRQGVQQGIQQGVLQNVVQKVCQKLQKGKSIEVIAEELEEDLSEVEKIVAVQQKIGNYDVEQICKALTK